MRLIIEPGGRTSLVKFFDIYNNDKINIYKMKNPRKSRVFDVFLLDISII